MERRLAIFRLVICYVLCACLSVSPALYIIILKKAPLGANLQKNEKLALLGSYMSYFGVFCVQNEGFSLFQNDFLEKNPENDEKKDAISTQNSAPQNTVTAPNNNSVPAQTGAVKGNVIEKYISPYTAKLSYNGVYMKNSTSLSINIKNLLNSKLSYKIEKNNQPQVLIVHTHTTETFLENDAKTYGVNHSSRTTDNSKNMAAVGAIIAEKLNQAGIKTIHDKTQHDYPQYNGSYGRSAKTVNSYLNKYKSIKIVLDLHRDSVTVSGNDKAKLVANINGKKAAQVMLVMGSQSGSIKNHPNWQENLKLAVKLQQTIENKYPTLARPISLVSKNYNQSLSKGALLIEFGTDMNSLPEVKYSAELVADSLISLLNTVK